jgi:hypothetical protein
MIDLGKFYCLSCGKAGKIKPVDPNYIDPLLRELAMHQVLLGELERVRGPVCSARIHRSGEPAVRCRLAIG